METSAKQRAEEYWQKRAHSIYFQVVRQLVEGLAEDAESMLDVGSAGCPYLDWFDWIPHRTSIDIGNPYSAPGVHAVKADFLKWEPDRRYDVVTCLQVLEHIPEAEAFAEKLLEVSDILVVSVPYKWTAGRNKTHVHDPVDKDKVQAWFKRRANFTYICQEILTDSRRLIHVYERNLDERWASIKARGRIPAARGDGEGAHQGMSRAGLTNAR